MSTWLKNIRALKQYKVRLRKKVTQLKPQEQSSPLKQEELVNQLNEKTQDSIKLNKLELVTPSELPVYRYLHPYGTISVYCPLTSPLSPERVLLLLEQAKFDLLLKKPTA